MATFSEIASSLQGRHTWLKPLVELDGLNLDKIIGQALTEWRDAHKGETPEYDPLQFERWLNDVGMLLDRCLAYRREYNDLVGSAVRQALEYNLFEMQRDSSEDLEKASWVENLKRAEAAAQANAAAQFEKDPNAPLASGFAETARGAQSISAQTADAEVTRKGLVSTRWQAYIDYQEQLEARHTAPGHPLNFAERGLRVRELLLQDLLEAASKYHSAAAGIYPNLRFGFIRTLYRYTRTPRLFRFSSTCCRAHAGKNHSS
jgi:hypothetical protein